jgi:hypothetical protein
LPGHFWNGKQLRPDAVHVISIAACAKNRTQSLHIVTIADTLSFLPTRHRGS